MAGEFWCPSSIRTPRLSDVAVCLPLGSDNLGSTVFDFSLYNLVLMTPKIDLVSDKCELPIMSIPPLHPST